MRGKGPIIFLVIALVLFVVVAVSGPAPLDWSENYSNRSTTPFGNKLLFERIGDIFPKGGIINQDKRINEFLDNNLQLTHSNYLIITKNFKPDIYEEDKLLEFVARGNTLFVAASDVGEEIGRRMGITVWPAMDGGLGKDVSLSLSQELDPSTTEYALLRNIFYSNISGNNKAKELGWDNKKNPVFIRRTYGDGEVIFHSVPYIFTNFYLVDPDNYRYISMALSVMKDQPTYWDEYFKPNRQQVDSPVRYILLHPALRYAWILAIVGVVLFALFRGKRRQRIIPIVAPPANTTMEFAETIGMLYQATGSHKDMATKKIRFFFDHLRQRFKIPAKDLNEGIKDKIAARSGLPRQEISILIDKIRAADMAAEVSDIQFLDLCGVIDDFYRKTK